jgi:predicted DNA-binding protein with PD1-like motif
MHIFPLRLTPGADLKQSLKAFAQTQQLQAGFILSAIGSLTQASLRFADQPHSTQLSGRFELLSLSGTLSMHGMHLHGLLADATGQVLGGHLDQGCLIYTTAEIIVGASPNHQFGRQVDPQTGFLELAIAPNPNSPLASEHG